MHVSGRFFSACVLPATSAVHALKASAANTPRRPDSLMAFMYGLVGLPVPEVAAISQRHETTADRGPSISWLEPSAYVDPSTVVAERELGVCVAGAVRKAIFEPTFHGGAFSYPFVF